MEGHYLIYHEKIYFHTFFRPEKITKNLTGIVHEKQEIPEKLLGLAKTVAVQITHSKGYELIDNLDKPNLSAQPSQAI